MAARPSQTPTSSETSSSGKPAADDSGRATPSSGSAQATSVKESGGGRATSVKESGSAAEAQPVIESTMSGDDPAKTGRGGRGSGRTSRSRSVGSSSSSGDGNGGGRGVSGPPPPPPTGPPPGLPHKPPAPQNAIDRTIIEAVSFLSRNQGGGPATGTTSGGGVASAPDTVDTAIESLLGARPENGRDFRTLLSRAFTRHETGGRTEIRYQRPSTAGVMMLQNGGSLTGAQATIVNRATSTREEIFRHLDALQPLELVPDPDLVRDVRALIHDVVDQVVAELSLPGGPNIDRVDQLLGELAGADSVAEPPATPAAVTLADTAGLLRRLQDVFGLARANISSLDDERTFTSFGAIVSEVAALVASWISDRDFLDPFLGQPFLGTQIVQIERSLTVVAQAVTETRRSLERAEVELAEQSLPIPIPGKRSISLGSILDWVDAFARTGGNRLRHGGQDGIESFAAEADRLTTELQDLITQLSAGAPALSLTGRNSLPVLDSLRSLRTRVSETRDLARRLIDDLTLDDVFVSIRRSPAQSPAGAVLWPGFRECLVVTGEGFQPQVSVRVDFTASAPFEHPRIVPAGDDELLLPIEGEAAATVTSITVTSVAGTTKTLVLQQSGSGKEGK